MSAEDSRTFLLDKQLVEDLASADFSIYTEALDQLPEGLNRVEVSDIGIQVSMVPGAEALRQGERLEKRVIFLLGCSAVIRHGDLVTATSASRELRSRGDIVGWLMLANRTRKAKRHIIKSIENFDSEPN